MEKETPTGPKLGAVSAGRGIAPHVLHTESIRGNLQRRTGHPMNQIAGEGSLSLEQWEAQWQEFLRTLESSHSPCGVPSLPEKPSPWEDAKAFLGAFEQVAEACRWPNEEWVIRLLPALSGEAVNTFNSLDDRDKEDYGKVKAAILRGDALSREKEREEFRLYCFQEAEGPRVAYSRLQEMCHRWLRVENHSKEQILELLILEQLLSILPPEIQSHVRESGPESCSQAVALAEEFLLRRKKQIPLDETTGMVFEAGENPSESTHRHPIMDIKEEEGGEASPLGSLGEPTAELQVSSSENAKEEDSEGNFREVVEIKRKEGNDTDENRDKAVHIQGGGFHEGLVQKEGPTKNRRKGDLCSNQRIYCKEKEKETVLVGKTVIQKMNIVSQERVSSREKPYNCLECGESFSRQTTLTSHQRIHSGGNSGDEEEEEQYELTLAKAKDQVVKGNLRNLVGAKGHEGSHLGKKRYQPSPCQGEDFHDVILKTEEKYKCLECGMDFSDQTQYNTHLQMHSGKNTPKRLECGKSFGCRSELLSHQRIHPAGKAYSCLPCGKNFSHKASLIRHQIIHSDKKPFICSESGKNVCSGQKDNIHFPKHTRMKACKCFQCGKYFRGKSHLLIHQRTHSGEKPFACSECGKQFSRHCNLQRHLRIHTGQKLFQCLECGKKFSGTWCLHQHLRIHKGEEPFECSDCGKKFSYYSNLQRHLRSHTGEKPFECSDCGKKFSQYSDLQRHLRIHTGEKSFECSNCGKKFNQYVHLQRHLRSHTGEKPFECSECEKKFIQYSDLQRHLRTHTGEKPFECLNCGKKFSQYSDLQRHLRTHTGEKPFECSECGKKFSRSCNLQQHLRTHTGERCFECSECGKRFKSNSDLQGHQRTHKL